MKRILPTLLALLLIASAYGQKAVFELTDGEQLQADSYEPNPDGTITLRLSGGATKLITPAQIKRMKIPEPTDLVAAKQAMAKDQWDAAIPRLQGVIKRHRNLTYDIIGSVMLADCYLGKGDAAEAVKVLDKLGASNQNAKDHPLVRSKRWQVSIEAGKFNSVGGELDAAIRGGDRKLAAVAQMRRGDMNMKKKLYDEAIMDFMRTMIFFKNDADIDTRAEATYRCAEALKAKKDNRANKIFNLVAEDFPTSIWAIKAQSR